MNEALAARPTDAKRRGARLRRAGLIIAVFVGLAGLAVFLGGCGGGSGGSGSAPSGQDPSSPGSSQSGAVAFAQCVRSHGVPNFPDPTSPSAEKEFLLGHIPGLDPQAPAFQ